MKTPAEPNPPAKGQFLVYQAEDGRMRIDVRLEDETAWLTQSQMAALFQTTVPNVNMHLRNIFAEGELQADSVIQEFLITAADGKKYRTNHYNLDAIISVGYRVKSAVATKPHMGLTNWRGAKVRKEDVTIAKNYLSEPELAALNNLVEQYLVFAESQAMRRVPMHMKDWIANLHAFLTINDRSILTHAGKASKHHAKLAVNSAKTFADFIFDTYSYQKGTRKLK